MHNRFYRRPSPRAVKIAEVTAFSPGYSIAKLKIRYRQKQTNPVSRFNPQFSAGPQQEVSRAAYLKAVGTIR